MTLRHKELLQTNYSHRVRCWTRTQLPSRMVGLHTFVEDCAACQLEVATSKALSEVLVWSVDARVRPGLRSPTLAISALVAALAPSASALFIVCELDACARHTSETLRAMAPADLTPAARPDMPTRWR